MIFIKEQTHDSGRIQNLVNGGRSVRKGQPKISTEKEGTMTSLIDPSDFYCIYADTPNNVQ